MTHYHLIYKHLDPQADHWRKIGLALGFFPNELDNIQSTPTLMTPSSYLSQMIENWLQWAPDDGRGSKNYATFEGLRDALTRNPDTAALACNLGTALGKELTMCEE